jgi:hypothetical protein
MKISIGRLTAIDPGEEWQSPPGVFWPHQGDWRVAANHYRAWADTWMKRPERPRWLREYVGWHHIIGKTYLGEIYFTFDQYLDIMKRAQETCGVDTLMLYGHTNIGCEGADYDISPAVDMGGKEGFRRLCEDMHRHGMKVMLFTIVNPPLTWNCRNISTEKWTIKDRLGRPRRNLVERPSVADAAVMVLRGHRWSGRGVSHCDEWWEGFLRELKALMELGWTYDWIPSAWRHVLLRRRSRTQPGTVKCSSWQRLDAAGGTER